MSASKEVTYSKGGAAEDDETEKKLRRLEKNRISARECRKRKKNATQQIEHQINQLEAENLQLRMQLRVGDEGDEYKKQQQDKVHQEIANLLKSGASEAEIAASIDLYKDDHLDYGKSSRTAIEYHLRHIERLLKPSPATAVIMTLVLAGKRADISNPPVGSHPAVKQDATQWQAALAARTNMPPGDAVAAADLAQNADPENPNVDPKDMMNFLFSYLDITPEQAGFLEESELVMNDLEEYVTTAQTATAMLREKLVQTGDDLEEELHVRSILTPTQSAKFLMWLVKNQAAVHLLEDLWKRMFPHTDPNSVYTPNQKEESENNK